MDEELRLGNLALELYRLQGITYIYIYIYIYVSERELIKKL